MALLEKRVRLDENPHARRTRRKTTEHPFGTMKDAHGRNCSATIWIGKHIASFGSSIG
jgi:hypothetical protein